MTWQRGPCSDILGVIIDEETLARRVRELGAELSEHFEGKNPLVLGILKGSFVFITDLSRAMDIPMEVDFMAVSSYGASTKSSGIVRITKDLDRSIAGRNVLLVEDIIDSGRTLSYLIENLETREPASITICTLLDKSEARKVPIEARFVGFECPDKFVVGYGLDYAERYRNLPYIGELKPEVYGA